MQAAFHKALHLLLAAMLALVGQTGAGGPAARRATPARGRSRPNIVFILTDDLSWNLVRFMPQVRRMQREGMTFTNYFVTDSLCCPSRASIFSGRYPHNTHVLTNTAPGGGWQAFHRRGAERQTFATALADAGYRTSMMGKYLNQYQPGTRYIPPGWANWQVSGEGYREFDYALNENGRVARFSSRPRAYLTDVLRRRGMAFVRSASSARRPFFLEIATFAPHKPYVPAPRDRYRFPFLTAPQGAAFDAHVAHSPAWLANRPPLDPGQVALLDEGFRRRAQSVQAVDELIGRVRRLLRRRHLARSTYVVFSSDNGYHMGQRRLMAGKQTPYDTDIRVPLVVVGPGVPPGSVSRKIAENVDLAPTFIRLGRGRVPADVDGHGLTRLLHGRRPVRWRRAALIEHRHPPTPEGDPDAQRRESGDPPSYEAIRTSRELYVEYRDGDREWYDLRRDPRELRNRYGRLGAARRRTLHARLRRLERCHGRGCRRVSGSPGFDARRGPATTY